MSNGYETLSQLFELSANSNGSSSFNSESNGVKQNFIALCDASEILWQISSSFDDLLALNHLYLRGKLLSTPYRGKPVGNKISSILDSLLQINQNGLLTVSSSSTVDLRDGFSGYLTFWFQAEDRDLIEEYNDLYRIEFADTVLSERRSGADMRGNRLYTSEKVSSTEAYWPFPRRILFNPSDMESYNMNGVQLGLATIRHREGYSNLFSDMVELSRKIYLRHNIPSRYYSNHHDRSEYSDGLARDRVNYNSHDHRDRRDHYDRRNSAVRDSINYGSNREIRNSLSNRTDGEIPRVTPLRTVPSPTTGTIY